MQRAMLSVVIRAEEHAGLLARTIAALVPAIADGLVGDGQVIAAKRTPAIEGVADAAGCDFRVGELAQTLCEAVSAARGNHVLFLQAGTILEAGWWVEAGDFLRGHAGTATRDAVFAYGSTASGPLARFGEIFGASAGQLFGRYCVQQGLIARRASAVARLGKSASFPPRNPGRVMTLRSRAFLAAQN